MCSVSWWNDLFQSFDCQIELVIISLDKTKKQSQVTHISYEVCLSVTDPVLLLVHPLGNPGLPSFLLACGLSPGSVRLSHDLSSASRQGMCS